jgi:hypothetical protein
MILIGLVIIIAVLMVLAVPRLRRMLSVPGARRRAGSPARLGHRNGDIINALTLRDVEAADRLALARLDDDGAPAAVTSVTSPGSVTAAHIPAGAAGAPAAMPGGLPSP